MKKPKFKSVEVQVDGDIYKFLSNVAKVTGLKVADVASVIIALSVQKKEAK